MISSEKRPQKKINIIFSVTKEGVLLKLMEFSTESVQIYSTVSHEYLSHGQVKKTTKKERK